MPLVDSNYKAKGAFKNAHFSTIYSAKLRPIPRVKQIRERLWLPDNDFIDVDYSFTPANSKKVTIVLHGLEGNAQRVYIKGQAKILVNNGWNVAALNHRGCSGEENKLYSSYSSGKTDDLSFLINHLIEDKDYEEISLVGFSLGGNLILKYLGENSIIPPQIKSAVAVSSPLQLSGSLNALMEFRNWVYRTSFILDLRKKYRRKMEMFPEKMNSSELKKIKTLLDFDNIYTAPAHGFQDASEYYEKSSSLQFLSEVSVPVLILNALNDSFLSADCFPFKIAQNSDNIYLETPKHGGHVGFHKSNSTYYSEERVLDFIVNLQ